MDTGLLITLIVAILTLAAGIIGAVITIIYKSFCDKREKRVIPTVAIWNDKFDDIDEKLEFKNNRWFFDLDTFKIKEFVENRYYYFYVRSYQAYKMYKCIVTYTDKATSTTKKYNLGTVMAGSGYVIPIKILDNSSQIRFTIEYDTERQEHIKYEVSGEIDLTHKALQNEQEEAYIYKRKRYRKLGTFTKSITASYSSTEVKERFVDGDKLNKR